ncbi:uncharacterized protein [Ptychodera flava]|uniref:uncharacterized protein n=1 Tax=Ptychodera flava TaxID=63121 RepID=UPI00396A9F8E
MAKYVEGVNSQGEENVRKTMQDFWTGYSHHGASVKEMLLDSAAEAIADPECQEILSMLPNYEGKRILELGAGIGRYTGFLARRAAHVTAVDFTEAFVEKNRQTNGHFQNVDFVQADVTKLELSEHSYDIVFSNWLMMYLTDDEVLELLKNILLWLTEDGYMFFRESCYRQVGEYIPHGTNPTRYRDPSEYNALHHSALVPLPDADGAASTGFQLIFSKAVQTYIKVKKTQRQVCWLLQKKQIKDSDGRITRQCFLDNQQRSKQGILQCEMIFGHGYVNHGGLETTKELVDMLQLQAGQRVLDVGCGLGGADFYMAESCGVDVLGVDFLSNVIETAMERAADKTENSQVQFEVCDITRRGFEVESFDRTYSRETILHVSDKRSLFANFFKWTKPGGKVLITDYCCGPPESHSEEFQTYVAQRGYTVCTPTEYGKLLSSAGFSNVKAEDRTNQFVNILSQERKQFIEQRDDFLKEFSEEDYQRIVDGMDSKLKRCQAAGQQWCLFYAEKQ